MPLHQYESALARSVIETFLSTPPLLQTMKDTGQFLREQVLLPLKAKDLFSPDLDVIFETLAAQHSKGRAFIGAKLTEYSPAFLTSSLEGRLLLLQTIDEVLQSDITTVDQFLAFISCLEGVARLYTSDAFEASHDSTYHQISAYIFPTPEEQALSQNRPEPMRAHTYGIETTADDIMPEHASQHGSLSGKAQFMFTPGAVKTWFEALTTRPDGTTVPRIAGPSTATAHVMITLLALNYFNQNQHFDLEKAKILANAMMGGLTYAGDRAVSEIGEVLNRVIDYVAIELRHQLSDTFFQHETPEEALPYHHIGSYQTFLDPSLAEAVLPKAQDYATRHMRWPLPIQTEWTVIAGPPCSGKTTIGEALKNRGFPMLAEAARAYIEELIQNGENIEAIVRTANFTYDIFKRNLALERTFNPDEPRIIDSAHLSSYAHLESDQHDMDQVLAREVQVHADHYRYKRVFLFDPLAFVNDACRTEDGAKQADIHRRFKEIYRRFGYTGIEVPRFSPDESTSISTRTDFILSHLRLKPDQGILYVITGPCGAGKTTMVKDIVARTALEKPVPYTTRPARKDEVDGVDYHFVTQARFNELLEQDAFFQQTEVFGNQYGVLSKDIHEPLSRGQSLIIEIRPESLDEARRHVPSLKAIFVYPKTPDTLKQQLSKRSSESEAELQQRYQDGIQILHAVRNSEYDYHILNAVLTQAIKALEEIISFGTASPAPPTHSSINKHGIKQCLFFSPPKQAVVIPSSGGADAAADTRAASFNSF